MDKVISLVATETQTILIYDNTSLKWATQSPFVPMALRRGTFQVRLGNNVEPVMKKTYVSSISHYFIDQFLEEFIYN